MVSKKIGWGLFSVVSLWMRPLSDKERVFVAEYVVSLNAADAAERAGFSRAVGPGILHRAQVREAIDRVLEVKAARAGRTAADVLEILWRNIVMAQERGAFAAANSGIKLFMEHLGMFPKDDEGGMARPMVPGTAIQINIGRDSKDGEINAEIVAGRAVFNGASASLPGRVDGSGAILVPEGDSCAGSGDPVRAVRGSGVRGEELWPEDGDA